MQVPASEVLSWLASGAMEQVGELPDEVVNDPVFTITSHALRHELAVRLAQIGKPTVVLTPLRVRSFLLRAMLACHGGSARKTLAAVQPEPAVDAPILEADLARLLQDVAAEVEADVEAMLRLAEEEAHLEATTEPAAPAPSLADPTADEGEEIVDAHPEEGDMCFDADDLASALDALDPEPVARPNSIEPVVVAVSADELVAMPTENPTPPTTIVAADTLNTTVPTEITMAGEPATAALDAAPLAPEADPSPVMAMAATAPLEEAQMAVDPVVELQEPSTAKPVEPPSPTSTSALALGTHAEPANAGVSAALVSQAMGRVEAFLDQLKGALVELAQRPAAAPIDMAPLVQVMQSGIDRAAEQATATSTALATLSEHVGAMGPKVESGVGKAVATVLAHRQRDESAPTAAGFVITRTERRPVVLMALAALVVAWSVLFWVKTGSPRLALGTLLGANLVGCCLLTWRRS